jgi:hypothetical protein
MAIDFTTNLGKVRVLTGDTRELLPDNSSGLFMSDGELNALLGMNTNNVTLTAIAALEVMATKHAIIMQQIKTLDLQTNGPAVAKVLLDRAKQLRLDYEKGLEDAGSEFELIEMMLNGRQYGDWLKKQYNNI